MKWVQFCVVASALAVVYGAPAEVPSAEKRALGCRDGCQPYPSGTGRTGTAACIYKYGDMFRFDDNTWGDRCCPSGCGKAEGRSADEETFVKESEPVEKRALGCKDGCQPFPSGIGKTGTNACIHKYGNKFDLRPNSYGDQCCPRGCGDRYGRSADEETFVKESEPVEKRALGCKDGCQPFPSGTGKTGTNACIHKYGNMFDLMPNSYGDRCCPRGCSDRYGRSADEETFVKESEPVEKRALGCRDGCQPYPSGTGRTGNAACIYKYGDMFKLMMNTWGDKCCPTGCGKAEG